MLLIFCDIDQYLTHDVTWKRGTHDKSKVIYHDLKLSIMGRKTKNSLEFEVSIMLSGETFGLQLWTQGLRTSDSMTWCVRHVKRSDTSGKERDTKREWRAYSIACVYLWLKFVVLFSSAIIFVIRLCVRYKIYHGVPVRVVQCHSL